MGVRRRPGFLVFLLGALVVSGCSSSSSVRFEIRGRGPGLSQNIFVAANQRQSKLGLFDASSGRLVRWLLNEPYKGMTVDATSVDQTGQIWVTLNSGPMCSSDVAGCGPKPNSCSGEVLKLNLSTGAMSVVLKVPDSELISDAQPSPNGRYLAYLDGVCNTSYFNQHIRVRDETAPDRSWTIGAGLLPCHSLGSISWASDSAHLAVQYGTSRVKSGQDTFTGDGTCSPPLPAGLAVVAALTPRPGITGQGVAADTGCQIEAVTALRSGFAAIEGCGTPINYMSGPVRLIRYSETLQPISKATIGSCLDGAEIRSDQTGAVLLGTTYQFCNPPGTQGPFTVSFTDRATTPVTFYDQPNGGLDTFRAISW